MLVHKSSRLDLPLLIVHHLSLIKQRRHFDAFDRITQLHKFINYKLERIQQEHETTGQVTWSAWMCTRPIPGRLMARQRRKGGRRRSLRAIWGRFGEPLGSNQEHSPLKTPGGKRVPLSGSPPMYYLGWGRPALPKNFAPTFSEKYPLKSFVAFLTCFRDSQGNHQSVYHLRWAYLFPECFSE